MDHLSALGVASVRFVEQVAALDDDQWAAPTPCDGWSVRDLVAHVVGGNRFAVGVLSGRSSEEALAEVFSVRQLGDDPVADARASTADQQAAFGRARPLGIVVDHPLGEMPAPRFLGMRMVDVVAHTWDLTAALGEPWGPSEELSAAALAVVRAEPPGLGFGIEPTPAPAGPSSFDELLHLLGRRPPG